MMFSYRLHRCRWVGLFAIIASACYVETPFDESKGSADSTGSGSLTASGTSQTGTSSSASTTMGDATSITGETTSSSASSSENGDASTDSESTSEHTNDTSTDSSSGETATSSEDSDSESTTDAQETSGSTSSGTDTGTNSTTGSSTGDSTDTGEDPIPCDWHVDDNECGAGFYCDAPNCQNGFCQPRPSDDQSQKDPVCGCDDINYWNETVALRHGMTIKHTGICNSPKGCGGITGATCPPPTYCEVQRGSENACNLDIPSQCWGMPKRCDDPNDKVTARTCNSTMCQNSCKAIKAGLAWYQDVDCDPN